MLVLSIGKNGAVEIEDENGNIITVAHIQISGREIKIGFHDEGRKFRITRINRPDIFLPVIKGHRERGRQRALLRDKEKDL